jgi:hypothetical protein
LEEGKIMQQNRHIDDALRQVPFFAQLSQDELSELSARLVARRFSTGQIIFHYGDPGGLLYIIQKGKIKSPPPPRKGKKPCWQFWAKTTFLANLPS